MTSPYGLPTECYQCHLRAESFFCALSEESLAALRPIKHDAVFPKRASLFIQGQTPRGVFILCDGQVRLFTCSRGGKMLTLQVANAGDVLGLDAVITGAPYELTAETTRPSRLGFVEREDFLRFLNGHADASLKVAQHVSRACHDAYEVARFLGFSHSAFARVAKFLLVSSADGRVTDGSIHAMNTQTHEEIAQQVCTSRETITRVLSDFKKKHLAELKGTALIIHDKPALQRIAEATGYSE